MTRNAAYLVSVMLMVGLCIPGGIALGDDDSSGEEARMTAYELQIEIETRQAAYADARAEADEASAAIEADQERIEELEREIPKQQARSAAAARELYKFQQQGAGLVDMLLNADNFQSFLAELEYMNKISDANIAEMNRLSELKDEITATQNGLKEKYAEADARAEDARLAMMAAQETQAEVQRRIEEEARQQALIAAQAEAMAAQERDNNDGNPVSPETGTIEEPTTETPAEAEAEETENLTAEEPETTVEAPSQEVPAGVDDSVIEWAKRIDAYLAGSPLAGQGLTFAKAASEYGVDPRFSPAISYTESGKGQYCFNPHNAWGWGSASWDSWEEAIYDHVAGLANGYGGQISIEGAKKYCPPNWKSWYDRTLGQMELI